jgi:hypothetical protein
MPDLYTSRIVRQPGDPIASNPIALPLRRAIFAPRLLAAIARKQVAELLADATSCCLRSAAWRRHRRDRGSPCTLQRVPLRFQRWWQAGSAPRWPQGHIGVAERPGRRNGPHLPRDESRARSMTPKPRNGSGILDRMRAGVTDMTRSASRRSSPRWLALHRHGGLNGHDRTSE